jgi:hypothetical protein
MGTKFTFKCSNCGYRVATSGGHDYGMSVVTETFICGSCKNIADSVQVLMIKPLLPLPVQNAAPEQTWQNGTKP